MKSDPESFKEFGAAVAEGDKFISDLDAARQDPTSKEARQLLKRVARFVSSAGKEVSWSGEERAAEITKLYAMWRRFGPASCFLPVAPGDVHQPTCIRLSYRVTSANSFPAVDDGLAKVLRK